MKHKLLIAGHGYLGRRIGIQAVAADCTITPLSRIPDPGSIQCDISNPEDLARLRDALEAPPTTIVHCASSGRGGPDAYRSVFLDGTRHLLATFPDTLLLFVSSSSVYGQTDGSVVTEDSPADPERETSRILREAENLVLDHQGIVARLAGIYGPARSVVLKRFLEGTAVIEEDGCRFLNQIHRDDAASAILHLLNKSPAPRGQIFNVADSTPLHQAECYRALAKLFDRPLPPTGPRNLTRKRAWTHKQVDNSKLVATGWHPGYPSFLGAALDLAPTLSDASDSA